MFEMTQLIDLLEHRQPGYSLPQAFYVDPAIYEFDLQAIFHRSWIMVGLEAELPRPGSYLATQVARSPVVIVRTLAGSIIGFHNSCRHRGAQICKTGFGRVTRLVCPYHQWTYHLDGTLLSARGAGEDFDPTKHGLHPIRVEMVAGCIYIALSDQAPDFSPFRRALEPALKPHNLMNVKVAHVAEYAEHANWKLVMENARECHHCLACHPEFAKAFAPEVIERDDSYFDSADPFAQRMNDLGFDIASQIGDWWQVGRVPFRDGFVSFSMDGQALVKRPLTDANAGNLGTLRWAIEPNNFCHVTSDCAFMFNVNPTGPLSTNVTAKWFVHKDAIADVDYQLDRLIHMWNQTNLQDRALAENNQCGVNGVGYRPGPYLAEAESYVIRFVDWYCETSRRFIQNYDNASSATRGVG